VRVEADTVAVEVVASSAPREVRMVTLRLPQGATVAEAVAASGLAAAMGADIGYAIWGRKATARTTLRDGDRVMLCRPLVAHPMESRRRRQAGQKTGAANVAKAGAPKTKRPARGRAF
jgi:uncharacterized protein